MRVHDTRTGKICDRKGDSPPYAILSHTWDASEQSFQDVQQIQTSINVLTLLRGIYLVLQFICVVFSTVFLSLLTKALSIQNPNKNRLPYTDRRYYEWPHPDSDLTRFRQVSRLVRIRIMSCEHYLRRNPLESLDAIEDRLQRQIISIPNKFRLSKKIRKACAMARFDYLSQLWVDTSCIDKTSSSELSEAINSMFAWYRDAAVCYAYLADVPLTDDPRRPGSAFRRSRWFTRGWTLQELIAPRFVVFLSREWEIIGTKGSLADLIEEITGVDRDVLLHRKSYTEVSVAARMSWAAERTTTRVEDQAYCLLGLFGIVMTPIYGEGENAFRRLQEEILRRIPDDSIFAWEMPLKELLEESRPQAASLSRDAAIPQLRYIRLLDTTTGRFVHHPGDRSVPYAVFSFIPDADEMGYQDLLQLQSETVFAVFKSVIVDGSLATAIFSLLLSILEIWYPFPFIFHLFLFLYFFSALAVLLVITQPNFPLHRWVSHFEHWSWYMRYSSILDDPRLSPKIRKACSVASEEGHKLLWMASACMDVFEKRTFLNSYSAWFRDAARCYVYLADVPTADNPRALNSAFRRSQWFTEYLTLPDLVVPREIIFLSQGWEPIGTKASLADLIEDITGIDSNVLTHRKPLDDVSVAERVSWGTGRSTAHVEDHAYCLSGLLDLKMHRSRYLQVEEFEPLFRRLRAQTLRRYRHENGLDTGLSALDQWRATVQSNFTDQQSHSLGSLELRKLRSQTLLAPSPSAFLLSGNIRSVPRIPDFCNRLETLISKRRPALLPEYNHSPCGIHTKFQVVPLPKSFTAKATTGAGTAELQWYLVILSCERTSSQGPSLLSRLCYSPQPIEPSQRGPKHLTLYVGEFVRLADRNPSTAPSWRWESLISLSKDDFMPPVPLRRPEVASISIPHPQPVDTQPAESYFNLGIVTYTPIDSTQPVRVTIPRRTNATLHAHGYRYDVDGGGHWNVPQGQTSTISRHRQSVPLITHLKKGEHEAAILFPIYTEGRSGCQWTLFDDEASETLRCKVVPSSDAFCKKLTSNLSSSPATSDLLKEIERTSQSEWKVGKETVRPTLNYVAPAHFQLLIDIVPDLE